MQKILIRKIYFVSLFKLMFVGFGVIFVPLFLFGGLAAYFNLITWTYNGEQLYGFSILLNVLCCIGFFPVGFAVMFGGVAFLGQWVFGLFRPVSVEVLAD